MMRPLRNLGLSLAAVSILTGCTNSLPALNHQQAKPFVPVGLRVALPTTGRKGDRSNLEVVQRLQQSGSFSWLDDGISRSGYSLLITEPGGRRANAALVMLGAMTLLTLPLPYSYEQNLRGTVLKDGVPVKSYDYHREGWGVLAWYAPIPFKPNTRDMLDELLRDLDREQVIPKQD
ncbi:hypothetical protein [Phytopseudomonas punonensis]|uniref:Lipoprotein n=1 Tax=Phytopseudomonas punonensis TaxID=1220495 RepID=A0A1M7GT34_9GAMM|nr:hypothetical protein [Pseudomonas punonensis]SHM19482.1 hypothetical protein SAMN05216288_3276 [Pseudomonas punonensis]